MESKFNEKQVQILIAAEDLFSEQGFNGASVRDIASRANVNAAMISYYFGSKEKLLESIFEYRIGATTIQLENLVSMENLSPLQKMDLIVDHYIEKLQNNTCFFRIMQSTQLNVKDNHDLRDIIYKSKKKNYDLLSALIAEGQQQKVFKKDVDISLLVSTLVGASNQIFIGQEYYKRLHQLDDMPDDKFRELLKKRMRLFLKTMFKAILTYEI